MTPRLATQKCGQIRWLMLGVLLAGLAAWQPARAQDSHGVIVELKGSADVVEHGNWEPASVGLPLRVGTRLRSGPASSVRIALHDGSVLELGADSEMAVEQIDSDAASGRGRATVHLVRGQLYSRLPGEPTTDRSVRVVSQTATAEAASGAFLVEYDAAHAVTEITGVQGSVAIHSALDPNAAEVLITARQMTTVRRAAAPDPPRPAERLTFPQIGSAQGDGLGSALPDDVLWSRLEHVSLLSGHTVLPSETASSVVTDRPGASPAGERHRGNSVSSGDDVSSLLGQSPAQSLVLGINLGH